MDKPTKHKQQIKALERTLVDVKGEIADASKELKSYGEKIEERKKELRQLGERLSTERLAIKSLSNSASDIFNKNINSVKEAISQRKVVNKTIKDLENTRFLIEKTIAEKKKEEVRLPGHGLVKQVIVRAQKLLNHLEQETAQKEKVSENLTRENSNLSDANRRLKLVKTETQDLVMQAKQELAEIEVKRKAHYKKIAEEEAKLARIKKYERDIRIMHKRIQDKYKKSRSNRSKM